MEIDQLYGLDKDIGFQKKRATQSTTKLTKNFNYLNLSKNNWIVLEVRKKLNTKNES